MSIEKEKNNGGARYAQRCKRTNGLCVCTARPRQIFSFYGKTLLPLDNFPFWMYPYYIVYTMNTNGCLSIAARTNRLSLLFALPRKINCYFMVTGELCRKEKDK